MLSCNRPLRRSCSGPVGGPSAVFKVGNGSGRAKGNAAIPKFQLTNSVLVSVPEHRVAPAKPNDNERGSVSKCLEWSSNAEKGYTAASMDQHQPANTVSNSAPSSNVGSARGRAGSCGPLRKGRALDSALINLASERQALRQEMLQAERRRFLSRTGSMASGMSSCSSSYCSSVQRSTVLDLELHLERERREAAEAELAALKAKLCTNS